MTEYVSYNGKFYPTGTPLVGAGNRGLRYGDGLFETLRYTQGSIHWMDWHFDRLFNGLQLLEFEIPAHFSSNWLADQVTGLCKKNQHTNARVRINVFRGNGGLYDAENHLPHCIIESWQLPQADFALNDNGLVTGIYPDARKAMDKFSNCKHNNYLPYTMAALYAKKQHWNDALLLNAAGRICDASIANVFVVKNNCISTPPLEEAGVAGIMRRFMVENLPAKGFQIKEAPVTIADIKSADEVFLTNAIQGIRWVSHCGETVYDNRLTKNIFASLLKK